MKPFSMELLLKEELATNPKHLPTTSANWDVVPPTSGSPSWQRARILLAVHSPRDAAWWLGPLAMALCLGEFGDACHLSCLL